MGGHAGLSTDCDTGLALLSWDVLATPHRQPTTHHPDRTAPLLTMVTIKSAIVFGAFLALTSVILLLHMSSYLKLPFSTMRTNKTSLESSHRQSFLVDTPVCRIPDMDPFDRTIARFVNQKEKLVCPKKHTIITYVDRQFLRFNWTLIKIQVKTNFSHCYYQTVSRNPEDHSTFSYGGISKNISADVEMKEEFIRLMCFDQSGTLISTAFHCFPLLKKDVEERCDTNIKKHRELHRPKEVLSVQLLGIDSVSRLNFMRQMPLTREFLLNDLQAVEMLGYNKVGDNTIVNIVPLMSGKFLKELVGNTNLATTPFDEYPLVWKNFSANGYRTMFSEDCPSLAAFDFEKRGFRKAPTDYYNRGLSVAMERQRDVWSHSHCVNNMLETELVLKYTTEFARQFNNKPYFSFTFITRLTHDNINYAGIGDNSYFHFIKTAKTEGLLNNTVLIFFSDHGFRFGDIRKTYIGKAEERLPFFFMVFPDWFRNRYPDITRNLRLNSKRLTTPYDVYETLKDVLYFDGKVRLANVSQRGISLFREIPEARSCAHAGILPHWCTCMDRKVVSPSTDSVQKVAHWLVEKINSLLNKTSDLCANLTLHTVHKAEEFEASDALLRYEGILNNFHNIPRLGDRVSAPMLYQVTIETVPGHALFEATALREDDGNIRLEGDISRINRYGSQSNCVSNPILKKLCYCT